MCVKRLSLGVSEEDNGQMNPKELLRLGSETDSSWAIKLPTAA